MVYKLKKNLYGLKQASQQWYKKFNSFMMSQEYKRTFANPYVYVQRFHDGKFVILLLYVDDILIVRQDAYMIRKLKRELSKTFDMKDLGTAKHILGMKILWIRRQANYGYHRR